MEVQLRVHSMGQPVWILARSIRSDEISPTRSAQCSNVKSPNLSRPDPHNDQISAA